MSSQSPDEATKGSPHLLLGPGPIGGLPRLSVEGETGATLPLIWRVGRKVGRTIYRQTGSEPSDDDELIGVMDTPELAALVVAAVNDRAEP
jgi:hypothetical protein